MSLLTSAVSNHTAVHGNLVISNGQLTLDSLKLNSVDAQAGNVLFYTPSTQTITRAGNTVNGRISIVDLGQVQHNFTFINGVLAQYVTGALPAAVGGGRYDWNKQYEEVIMEPAEPGGGEIDLGDY